MTQERFEEIEKAIRESMYDDVMLGELAAYTRSQQIIIDTQNKLIAELQRT